MKAEKAQLSEFFEMCKDHRASVEFDRLAPPGHPSLQRAGQLLSGTLNKQTHRNLLRHVDGCHHCRKTASTLALVAAKTARIRQDIRVRLGLTVSLVDAYRAGKRNFN